MSAGLIAAAQGRLAGRAVLPDGPRGARRARLPGRGGRRPRPLPPRLQPGPGGPVVAAADRPVLASTPSSTALFFFLPRPIRLLILKDLRTFRRDPAQWSQFLIFFGLLAFYFLNIRRLGYDVQSPYWRNLVSFLNLAVTALILSTFTSRFIFPLLSLEGRNFWVLGLLPLRRERDPLGQVRVLGGDLAGGDRGPGRPQRPDAPDEPGDDRAPRGDGRDPLPRPLGDQRRPGGAAAQPQARATLRRSPPGFGGTLNLLVSLVFIFAIVTALALPCHLYFAGQEHRRARGARPLATSGSASG